MHAELGRRFEVFRAHQRALSGCRPQGRIRANTVLIGAESSLNHDALPRWRELLDGPVSARYLAGDHYSFLHGSGAGEIARLINDAESGRSADQTRTDLAGDLANVRQP